MIKFKLTFFVLALWLLNLISLVHCQLRPFNKLIYIMIDGFRYDYVDDQNPNLIPGFAHFLRNGVRSDYMQTVFPSTSYPAWTTLVTGLYPESHGIVGNYFYDSQARDVFSLFDIASTGKKKWWTAEPIWITATKNGLRTAVIHWSRCDIPFRGILPHYCEPFVQATGVEIFRANIEKAIVRLQEGYDFIQVYSEHLDNIGHSIGPETEGRRQAVREVDATIFYLQQRIEEFGLTNNVNIVLVSDHGMTSVAPGTVSRVELDDYLITDYVEAICDAGAFSNIKVLPGYINQVYSRLRTMPGVDVYLKPEIPEELHFKYNKYIYDIVIKAKINTWIMKSRSPAQIPPRDDSYVYLGAHGYDPREEKMRAIFFAKGPDFRVNERIPPIESVDVYPLLIHLLQINPLPNNGTFKRVRRALQSDRIFFGPNRFFPPLAPNLAPNLPPNLAQTFPAAARFFFSSGAVYAASALPFYIIAIKLILMD